MNVIKAEQPNITAVIDDLYKPFVAYKSLRSLSVKSEDLYLVYKFFVSDLSMSGKLEDDNINETVRDMISWFVSNRMTDNEKKFFNAFMTNLLDMTGLHKKGDISNVDDTEDDDVSINETDDFDFEESDENDNTSVDDEFDDIFSDDLDNDEEPIDDYVEDMPDETDVDDTPINPVDIDAVAVSKCYQCKLSEKINDSNSYRCTHHNKNVDRLCSSEFNWEHPCPNFEYDKIK